MKIFYEEDCNLKLLQDKHVGIIGFGSQGHAHAQNLRDSGINLSVAELKGGPSWNKAVSAGFDVVEVPELVSKSDILMFLAPDTSQKEIYEKSVKDNLVPGKYLGFAHGFNIHYNQIVPNKDINVFMVAPKAPGHTVRDQYESGAGVPALIAVHQDASGDTKDISLAYASGIGSARVGIIETTFKDETETDLFGEQTVLCGGLSSLILAGFETLTEAGYPPEMAYFECCHEVKLIVDLIYEGGISNMRYSISDTAKYGDITRGPRVIDSKVKERMRKILKDIQSGEFAKEWVEENESGRPNYTRLLKEGETHPIEDIGETLRSMMTPLFRKKLVDKTKN
ncbi:MAG: ketol-acid reductoisomerase [Spirochaetales bacterium]|nr:ketol-acid reductoisomerase [Spirochaetales bacterium]|tara:strand:+ start:10050 stop:11066 length:1017 start_codon:yes stop_codon:yes gene_type:complete